MKVSVLSHDVSHNCLGRAEVIASLLAPQYDVEIVGPARGGTIWPPLDGNGLSIRPLPARAGLREIAAAADGDVLFAVKPRAASLGAALLARERRPRPVVADVDDWEMAFFYDNPRWMARNLLDLASPDNFWRTLRMQRQVGRADAVTVSSSWLQRRFGGTVVPHARGDQVVGSDRDRMRASWGIGPEDFAVVFLGSVRPHKIRTTLLAVDEMADPAVRLVLIDPERIVPDRPYLVRIDPLPFARVQEVLGGGDAVVLAQADSRIGRAQMPAKVFDAMAVGVPVIATSVSDLPQVLGGDGVLVPPDSPGMIAAALSGLKQHPQQAHAMGARARARFRAEYHRDVVGPRLCQEVSRVRGQFGRAAHVGAPGGRP